MADAPPLLFICRGDVFASVISAPCIPGEGAYTNLPLLAATREISGSQLV